MMTREEKAQRRADNKASAERSKKRVEENIAIVTAGKCPKCGLPLFRNSALTGWYQCAGLPSPGFRHKGFEDAPSCSFECFTV